MGNELKEQNKKIKKLKEGLGKTRDKLEKLEKELKKEQLKYVEMMNDKLKE
jgi:FtsZ-binding cell division protein ZapB